MIGTQARHTQPVWRAELRGRSAGIVVGAVFGLIWALNGRVGLPRGLSVAVLVLGVVVAAVLLSLAIRMRRAAARLPDAPPAGAERPQWRRSFTVIVAAEFAVIIALVATLGATGHGRWIPAVVCAVVGAHFAPLGRLFDVPLYYGTAVVMITVAVVTAVAGLAGAPKEIWTALPGLGAAVTLFTTSTIIAVTWLPRARAATSGSPAEPGSPGAAGAPR